MYEGFWVSVLPKEYGDIHAGFYNGDTYTRIEPNDQKAFQIRGSVRPHTHGDGSIHTRSPVR